ncbi:cytochrome P450 family protein [Streptacidiphilus monticola]|uniref:Cytochrome P450 n=1 Tax=Streptacidiphilus monticola TaxID=2161674 RepID=A0ABW1G760_9ACTN
MSAALPLVNDLAFKREAHARFAELRERGPVHHVTQPNGLDLYLVVGYDAARTALAHPDLGKDPVIAAAKLESAGVTVYQGGGRGLGANMLMADGADHTRLRGPVAKAFTPRRIESLRPRVQQITDALLDAVEARAAAGHEVDLVAEFTAPLPVTVICELLGVPLAAQDDFRRWTQAALNGGSAVPGEEARAGAVALNGYLAELIAEKRKQPGDDLLSALVAISDADGGALSEAELLGTAVILVVAGHETTVNLLGNALAALLDRPDQARLLRERPELLPGAVEEFLRWDAPVEQSTMRFARRDVELAGAVVPAGSVVVVALAAAGRDERAAADPATLDVTRTDGRHLSFGHGIHYCLGAPLARLEGEIALGTVLRRLPGLRLRCAYGELDWTPAGIMHGPLALPAVLAEV